MTTHVNATGRPIYARFGIYTLPFLFGLLFSSIVSAQNWSKGYDFGTTSSSENALAVSSDASGNFYFAGRFCQTVDFDPGSGTNNLSTEAGASTATQNTFLTKYSSTGDYVWAVQIGKSQSNVNVAFNGLKTDGTYIYVTGIINDTATFGSTVFNTNNSDIYVAKYRCSDGGLVWATKLGGTNADNVSALCIDGSGGIYIQGNYNTSTTMGSTTITVTGGGSAADLFWAKLNASDGSVSWLVGGGGTGTDGSGGIGALAYSPYTGKLVSGGVYNGATGTFGSYSVTNSGLNDVVILEINPATGAFTSAINYGTAGNEFIFGASYDSLTHDVFFAGNYENTVTIPGVGAMSASGTSTSSLLATRYSTSTHTFVWGKAGNMVTGSGTGVNNAFRCVTSTHGGAIYYGGSFNGNSTVTLTLAGTTVLAGSGNVDMVLARFNAITGGLEYAYTTGGTGGSEVIFGLSAGSQGMLGVAGQNSSTITLGSVGALSTKGTLDILMAFQEIGTVLTATPTLVGKTVATLGGNIAYDGGSPVTDRGVVYSTAQYPTTSTGTKVSMGTGTGSFSQGITGLTGSTTYYVRSFMTNSYGTFYSAQSSFTTTAVSMPLSLISFKAYQSGTGIQTEWKTTQEVNVDRFELERSIDGIHFSKIATLPAKGKLQNDYTSMDVQPIKGNNFYRLKMIDLDATYKYSSVVRVGMNNGISLVKIYPTVITGKSFVLEMENQERGNYNLGLYDLSGKLVYSQDIQHKEVSGSQTVTIPGNVSKGTYYIRVKKDVIVYSGKLVIQ